MNELYGVALVKNQIIDDNFINECKEYNSGLVQFMITDYERNKDIVIKNNLKVIIHCSYDFNICNPYYKESYNFKKLYNEIKYSYENSNIIGYVLHFGYIPKNKNIEKERITKEKAIENFNVNIIKCLKLIHQDIKQNNIQKKEYFSLLLEPLSGNINEIIENIDDLQKYIKECGTIFNEYMKGIKICLDTAHLYAMGYDLSDKNLIKVLKEIFNKISINNIGLIHLNDQEKDLGKHGDKHALLGKGNIGLKSLFAIYNICKTFNISFICETDGSVKNNIGLLQSIENKK